MKKDNCQMPVGIAYFVIIIFAIMCAALSDMGEPQFTITKEECWNETIIYDIERIEISSYVTGWNSPIYVDYGNLKIFLEKNPNYTLDMCSIPYVASPDYNVSAYCEVGLKEEREVCKQVEVDEIEVLNGEVLPSTMIPKGVDFEIVICGSGSTCPVYKEDLSIEWLDENCLCWMGTNQDQEDTYEICDFPKTIAKGTPAETIIKGTTEYKCGNYTIKLK